LSNRPQRHSRIWDAPNVWRAIVWSAALVAWEVIVRTADVASYVLPAPSAIVRSLFTNSSLITEHVLVTAQEILLGLALATAGALVWGVALVAYSPLRRFTYPLLIAAQSAPKEAFAPIFVIWFGFSLVSKVLMAALISFFPILVATMVGLESFDPGHRLLAASLGASKVKTFFSFRIWNAMPSFLSGVRLGVTLSAIGAVLGEFLGSDRGIGYLVLASSRQLDGEMLFASLVALSLVTWVMVGAIDLTERILLKGSRSTKLAATA
jgi:NitT/TauT family transport system permease protein